MMNKIVASRLSENMIPETSSPEDESIVQMDDSKEPPMDEALAWDWTKDKHNPYNWTKPRKNIQLVTLMSIAFTW